VTERANDWTKEIKKTTAANRVVVESALLLLGK